MHALITPISRDHFQEAMPTQQQTLKLRLHIQHNIENEYD